MSYTGPLGEVTGAGCRLFLLTAPHRRLLERRTSSFEKRALRRLQGSGWDAIQHRLCQSQSPDSDSLGSQR